MDLTYKIKILATAMGDGECVLVHTGSFPDMPGLRCCWASAERDYPNSPINIIRAARASSEPEALEALYTMLVRDLRKNLTWYEDERDQMAERILRMEQSIQEIQGVLVEVGEPVKT